ncbi:hypothetical protein N657DRAFT_677511 [Parathielavia appendiculata]|uniref:Uncharacterized protein n=1 Tax=Parathielavia appendiculata TaxID=2587402 RepID=A0AAN6U5I8_9PEZI|nr:hypothetical protein N657DRAFT_677511 [Parathielavia appendiculata]
MAFVDSSKGYRRLIGSLLLRTFFANSAFWLSHGASGYELEHVFPLSRAAPKFTLLRLFMAGCCGPLDAGLRLEQLAEQFGPGEAVAAVLEHTPNLKEFDLDLCAWMDLTKKDFTEDDMRQAKLVLGRSVS